MSNKIEKLKEINAIIAERCIKIETEIFIKNSNSINNAEIKKSDSKTLIETKR